jgi:glycosyltransferase involved in cell wall biosynthesis
MYAPQKPTSLLILEDGTGFMHLSSKYNVITTGWIDGEDLASALAAADIFVMPSVQETFGLMAVESMACGTPVVVFEGTSLPDVIHAPSGGIAVPSRDSIALAQAIKLLLDDHELCSRLGMQARSIAEQEYGVSMYVQRHMALYNEVIEQHKSGRRLGNHARRRHLGRTAFNAGIGKFDE